MNRATLVKIFAGGLAFMVLVVVLLRTADSTPPVAEPLPTTRSENDAPRLKAGPSMDIVTGEELDPKTSMYRAEFQGTELYFKSQESLDAFRADPLKYVKIKTTVEIHPVEN